MLAPPPWTFPNARVLYQPSFVPVDAARAVTGGQRSRLPMASGVVTTMCEAHAPIDSESFSLSLPSFSGCLASTPAGRGPLLRYPLRLGRARRVRLRPAVPTRLEGDLSDAVRAVLGGPCASPCLQVDSVTIVAGCPEAVS